MLEMSVQSGQLAAILMMAFALGLDAFSLGIGVGMRGIRLRHVLNIGLLTALFHMLMPLLGLLAGHYVGALLGKVTGLAAGGLLVLLGGHMIVNSFQKEEGRPVNHTTLLGMLMFSIGVSIDSFSVGVSLGMFAHDAVLIITSFGAVGGLLSICGLMIGRKAGSRLGNYGEMAGGAILLLFGLMFIF
ncbi:manganese efflux pump MntP family protein [Paenibacillus lemnae]|uniref:Putative manganese efflux pump MntP n=1 Tax=Paenibacillus lemnae TaxID=1330551 RepID=A0A848M4F3_PAELE|nr:manganese efflux pump [Paenibacillus lemnae]NMO94544.1 manganese efflux pump [Paenibacillus lemnae]